MSINATCDYLNGTAWGRPPFTTKSAISWLAPSNKTLLSSFQKCCGGRDRPLQFYENNCLAWCETGEDWDKVHACVQGIKLNSEIQGIVHFGNPQGKALPTITFPEEPDPPFVREEPKPPYKSCHQTRLLKIEYCITLSEDELDEKRDTEKEGWDDSVIEALRLKMVAEACAVEEKRKQRMVDEANGWSRGWIFRPNRTKMLEASDLKMKSCRLFHDLESRIEDLRSAKRKPSWAGFVIFIVICSKIAGLW